MRGYSRWITTLGVASALPILASAVAQDPPPPVAPAAPVQRVQVFVNLLPVQPAIEVQEKAKAEAKDDAKKAAERKVADDKRTDILANAVRAIERAVVAQPVMRQDAVVIRRAAVRAIAVAPAGANIDPDLDPMVAQWLPQFTPMVRTELHLLLSVSQATVDQKKTISGSRTKIAKEAAKLYAQSQQRIGRFQGSSTYPQPRGLVQECLTNLASSVLSPEQMDRYKAELKKRDDDQKELAIKNIIAKMDQDLVLSADQREKLDTALSKNWNATWCQSLESFMYGDQFFPAIPDNLVVPHLNQKQASVWKGTQRNGGMFFGGFGFGQGLEGDDFPEDESVEEVKEAAPAEKKADAAQGKPDVKANAMPAKNANAKAYKEVNPKPKS